MTTFYEVESLDGTTISSALVNDLGVPTLTLVAPSGFATEGGGYYPAESIAVSGGEAIAALLRVCERMLEASSRVTPLDADGNPA